MNLIEAQKLGHMGWVCSKKQTVGKWWRLDVQSLRWKNESGNLTSAFLGEDLETEDWEPKPWPPKRWCKQIWVHPNREHIFPAAPTDDVETHKKLGWRKIWTQEIDHESD